MFETRLPEARPIAILKKVFVGMVVALLAIGAVSSYRAYIQVKSLEIQASHVLAVGSKVGVSLVSSGRTTVDVQVQLIQHSHSQTLFTLQLKGNELGFFDPRTKSADKIEIITTDQLSGFQPGAATLRATATGRHQWMRLPPPTVREVIVEIQLP